MIQHARVLLKICPNNRQTPIQRKSYYESLPFFIHNMRRLTTTNDCFFQTRFIIKEWYLCVILMYSLLQLLKWNEECTDIQDSSLYCFPTFATADSIHSLLTLLHSIGLCVNSFVFARIFSVFVKPNPALSSNEFKPYGIWNGQKYLEFVSSDNISKCVLCKVTSFNHRC